MLQEEKARHDGLHISSESGEQSKHVRFSEEEGKINVLVYRVESFKEYNFVDQNNQLCCSIF